ncbi:AMIN domain-containing protein [Campylobacter insulaenigrae]|uniref:Putative periplasmic protein (AMIN domain) n=1 Tax=Campylobacter insulaenigrae NCTC 12927 TaxID=1031564 RepID=A0A0A8GYZ9_9BACT|nr:AMIN domain-containing protein [Campylobacter insulaenigrae]AJC87143.1 putative periplasmic protein (AMIN domain) [Campylobacter insulaenigrae NCTC 12927]MCR6573076.1 AMIN domain-containing protein [Campylobacter insulaenigrae]MCR6576128.1 AMIN domain-containing protein [Campylobacter insulaenigrae]MCR6580773.1 AMIN domain-containing protein [Campylobacter insulaenigrae]MCR6582297.1 AMIN domain-containing protein [Campylobacter insulaenigrae]
MLKIRYLIFLLLGVFLNAKENPFDNEMEKKNLEFENFSPFQRQDFNFDSNARILKNITLTYINLDGSEQQIILDINKSIDWHDNFAFIKSKAPNTTPILDVSVTVPKEKKAERKSGENNTTVNIETPLFTGDIYNFISLSFYNNKININTRDKMLRNLSIGDPTKIIVDFAKNQHFNTKTLQVNTANVKKVVFGSHKNFYRLVIYLDGKYDYDYSKGKNLHTFNLR